ncbi:hypothetical protein N7493_000395 [Penicillium malachiteum]|uniref:Uncharacterized protein n=1 Tax=Penicillium malachiteum TaxID=1324776 RepID=A0AAD6HWV2_9EURO|nr:hypothetical protein N7493_000395 [Penicillium malachiteum]
MPIKKTEATDGHSPDGANFQVGMFNVEKTGKKSAVAGPGQKSRGTLKTTFRPVKLNLNYTRHDPIAPAWTMSREGSAAKSHAVNEGTISIMVFGSVGAAIYRRVVKSKKIQMILELRVEPIG